MDPWNRMEARGDVVRLGLDGLHLRGRRRFSRFLHHSIFDPNCMTDVDVIGVSSLWKSY